jgi:hypothetical protein
VDLLWRGVGSTTPNNAFVESCTGGERDGPRKCIHTFKYSRRNLNINIDYFFANFFLGEVVFFITLLLQCGCDSLLCRVLYRVYRVYRVFRVHRLSRVYRVRVRVSNNG